MYCNHLFYSNFFWLSRVPCDNWTNNGLGRISEAGISLRHSLRRLVVSPHPQHTELSIWLDQRRRDLIGQKANMDRSDPLPWL